ncbi:MAG: hypothetical protein E6J87_22530 [Deltaproteobacteria bacterium]|nr:MAG: hypothetical protein E6J87_22530 [Deltaproteobacteria bacterium]
MLRLLLAPLRTISAPSHGFADAQEFRDKVTAVIPPEGGQVRGPERVGPRFIMQVPTMTPGLQIERSLRHAGIRARVAGVVRPLR